MTGTNAIGSESKVGFGIFNKEHLGLNKPKEEEQSKEVAYAGPNIGNLLNGSSRPNSNGTASAFCG